MRDTKVTLECGGLLILGAGSEQSTNFRWWDSEISKASPGRLDLNNPPTPVGGISQFSDNPLPRGGTNLMGPPMNDYNQDSSKSI